MLEDFIIIDGCLNKNFNFGLMGPMSEILNHNKNVNNRKNQ